MNVSACAKISEFVYNRMALACVQIHIHIHVHIHIDTHVHIHYIYTHIYTIQHYKYMFGITGQSIALRLRVFLCVFVFVCVCVYMCVCVAIPLCGGTQRSFVCMCLRAWMRVCVCVYKHTCVCVCIHHHEYTHTCVCIHHHEYTLLHKYIQEIYAYAKNLHKTTIVYVNAVSSPCVCVHAYLCVCTRACTITLCTIDENHNFTK